MMVFVTVEVGVVLECKLIAHQMKISRLLTVATARDLLFVATGTAVTVAVFAVLDELLDLIVIFWMLMTHLVTVV